MKKVFKIQIELDEDTQSFGDVEVALNNYNWELLEEYTKSEE